MTSPGQIRAAAPILLPVPERRAIDAGSGYGSDDRSGTARRNRGRPQDTWSSAAVAIPAVDSLEHITGAEECAEPECGGCGDVERHQNLPGRRGGAAGPAMQAPSVGVTVGTGCCDWTAIVPPLLSRWMSMWGVPGVLSIPPRAISTRTGSMPHRGPGCASTDLPEIRGRTYPSWACLDDTPWVNYYKSGRSRDPVPASTLACQPGRA